MLDKIIQSQLNLIATPEYRFHDKRKWRFDWAIVDKKICIEIEGAVWTNGRHTRGSGFIKDMEKYNTATAMGWRVIRIIPNDYLNALVFIQMILKNE